MASLTKPERNRIHRVLERDRMRKQFRNEGLPVPPLLDPDTVERGPGDGPAPTGADPGSEENKPSAAELARETRKAYAKRTRENIPAVVLQPTEVEGEYRIAGEPGTVEESLPEVATSSAVAEVEPVKVKPPKKATLEAITDKKTAGRDTNLRVPYDKEDQAKAVKEAQKDMPRASRTAATSSTAPEPESEPERVKKGTSR